MRVEEFDNIVYAIRAKIKRPYRWKFYLNEEEEFSFHRKDEGRDRETCMQSNAFEDFNYDVASVVYRINHYQESNPEVDFSFNKRKVIMERRKWARRYKR